MSLFTIFLFVFLCHHYHNICFTHYFLICLDTSSNKLTIDDLLKHHVGELGRYQIVIFLILSLEYMFLCGDILSPIFISETPPHWCWLPPDHLNCSKDELKSMLIPKDDSGKYSQCYQYEIEPPQNLTVICAHWNHANDTVKSTRQCDSWDFQHQHYKKTLVSEVS